MRNRPLPDERPRQSVANLIGRFETQTKRLSLTASSPSRSSSVVSHITGDSAKEDAKEKREWPPKSVTGGADRPPPSSFTTRHLPPALSTQPIPTVVADDQEVPLTAKALNASQRREQVEPNSFLENWRKDLPAEPAEMEPVPTPSSAEAPPEEAAGQATPTVASVQKMGASTTPRTPASKTSASKVPAGRPSAASSSKPPLKTPIKSSAPKQPVTPSIAQPLRPQHTGQSVASSAAARKPITKPPTTPARAKTPASAARAKTPTSARPKTPSTGLFAPTAASLARARNAQPQLPTPVKKATLSSSSMDRLSKPTAASLSKARDAPAATISKPTTSKPRTPAVSPRASAVKPKTSAPSSPSKVKKTAPGPRAAAGATAAATIATIGAIAAVVDAEEETKAEEAVENGHDEQSTEEVVEEPQEEVQEELASELEASAEHEAIEGEDNSATPRSPSPAVESDTAVADETTTEEEDIVVPATHGKDDLEDIVNLLQAMPISKLTADTAPEIPDDLLEIPDEEEK